MKRLFTTLGICLFAGLMFSSCNDKGDDMDDYYKQLEEQELRIDSILNAQKVLIEDYVAANLIDAEQDSIHYPFSYIDKKTKRGIWYFVEEEGDEGSYEYKINSTATAYVYPTVKLNYTARLLNGTLVESAEAKNFNFGLTSSVINNAWFLSFFPYSISLNEKDYVVGGLTEKGLKVGSKITVVTPSLFAYGSTIKTGGVADIPANSPLVYEFEVLDIE